MKQVLSVKAFLVGAALCIGMSLMTSGEAFAATRSEIKQMVIEEAKESRVPPALALAVAKIESDFQERALSTAGARGVMQIMPQTAQGVFGVHKDDLWDPRLNIQLGIEYLEQLYDQYGGRWDLALSHYNGGTLKGGKGAHATPHSYTRKYVASVMKWHQRYDEQAQVWQVASAYPAQDDWELSQTQTRMEELEQTRKVIVRELADREFDNRYKPWRAAQNGTLHRPWRKQSAWTDNRTDFDRSDFNKRLRAVRGTLDDFTPKEIWTEGS
ncbi:lytic transglycosylase domain-containing protein [Magnetovibrio sp. PR-2]|uniref:lytic transglycosylase domain-containing protein n=1 Tax=Magnetovibrio sp. PR-2 TaxID=3120356 RepID=UPI002FCDED69